MKLGDISLFLSKSDDKEWILRHYCEILTELLLENILMMSEASSWHFLQVNSSLSFIFGIVLNISLLCYF